MNREGYVRIELWLIVIVCLKGLKKGTRTSVTVSGLLEGTNKHTKKIVVHPVYRSD
jgi:hypothetical protein